MNDEVVFADWMNARAAMVNILQIRSHPADLESELEGTGKMGTHLNEAGGT